MSSAGRVLVLRVWVSSQNEPCGSSLGLVREPCVVCVCEFGAASIDYGEPESYGLIAGYEAILLGLSFEVGLHQFSFVVAGLGSAALGSAGVVGALGGCPKQAGDLDCWHGVLIACYGVCDAVEVVSHGCEVGTAEAG